MSPDTYYLERGYTPTWKTVAISAIGTATVWTPRTSTKIVLTRVSIGVNLAGSVAFYFGNLAGQKIEQFNLAASSYISVPLLADSDSFDRVLFANASATGTDGVKITVAGFEIPQA